MESPKDKKKRMEKKQSVGVTPSPFLTVVTSSSKKEGSMPFFFRCLFVIHAEGKIKHERRWLSLSFGEGSIREIKTRAINFNTKTTTASKEEGKEGEDSREQTDKVNTETHRKSWRQESCWFHELDLLDWPYWGEETMTIFDNSTRFSRWSSSTKWLLFKMWLKHDLTPRLTFGDWVGFFSGLPTRIFVKQKRRILLPSKESLSGARSNFILCSLSWKPFQD